MSRDVFVSYARYYVDSFSLPSRSADEIEQGFTVDGYHHVEEALAGEAGPILALPHLGGWEWAAFWLTRIKGERVSAVVEELRPPELFEWFSGLRRELGMDVIPLGAGAGAAVVRAIKQRHVTCLLSDRYLSGGGVPVEFFGERTMLPAGPATLALRTGAPLLPTVVYFRGRGVHGVVRPPIPAQREGKLRDDVARVTQAMACELEQLIAAAPEQWHLLQPNWPSDYLALGRPVPDWFG
jgi:KDO2-lipid IV(A) lauroyltransferase